jgi:hypothetical protein
MGTRGPATFRSTQSPSSLNSRIVFHVENLESGSMVVFILLWEDNIRMDKKNEQLSHNAVCESEKSDDVPTVASRWENLVKELKSQWRVMWRDRLDDKVRAEGIAREDYSLLLLKRGTIVIATRKYRPPDFTELLEYYRGLHNIERKVDYVNPVVGGYTKFVRDVLRRQPRFTRRKMRERPRFCGEKSRLQQKKKGGRGWVHRF